jgi:hypothetical protein
MKAVVGREPYFTQDGRLVKWHYSNGTRRITEKTVPVEKHDAALDSLRIYPKCAVLVVRGPGEMWYSEFVTETVWGGIRTTLTASEAAKIGKVKSAIRRCMDLATCIFKGHYWQSFCPLPAGNGSIVQCRRCRKLEIQNKRHKRVDPASI